MPIYYFFLLSSCRLNKPQQPSHLCSPLLTSHRPSSIHSCTDSPITIFIPVLTTLFCYRTKNRIPYFNLAVIHSSFDHIVTSDLSPGLTDRSDWTRDTSPVKQAETLCPDQLYNMPNQVSYHSKWSRGTLSSGISRARPPSPATVVPRTPDCRDSWSHQPPPLSSQSTPMMAPTTRSRCKVGKGTDWIASHELAFLNILKDHILSGHIKDCSPHAVMWPGLTAQFSEVTGLDKTCAQIQEKLNRMKKQWRRLYSLLNYETSF
ncbi:hypothetical protein CJ030_MR4G009601 [Morella rubra]|uniref:Myb/SANT-like domain-containing protein n=1 Tax=Morella rubra TaxID=262757 RepID=A0A6A1VTB0_9ROSI|nr:hypothetical protein CJ030_MR4G009601 [Morella rubra]